MVPLPDPLLRKFVDDVDDEAVQLISADYTAARETDAGVTVHVVVIDIAGEGGGPPQQVAAVALDEPRPLNRLPKIGQRQALPCPQP